MKGGKMDKGISLLEHMQGLIYNLMELFDKDGSIPFAMPDDFEEHLRSNGWVHKSDVVEGKTGTCDMTEDCPYVPAPHCHKCEQYRPATIKDLIEGRE
jgi:hypothetical protein